MADDLSKIGIVGIGRNEGERLERCLRSAPPGVPVVYVDSDSSDGSVAFARSVGAEVVELDLSVPFTAARARNEGYARLRALCPSLEFVQFVDGDCEMEQGWIDSARQALNRDKGLAAVCGRRRERYPSGSLYNAMCDDEWNTPIGEAAACGGDAMFRVTAFDEVGGFDPRMIAGEEPELCYRLRVAKWRILRLDAPMTIHDAAMHRFRQWWVRAVRSGFGYAQVFRATSGGPLPALYRREIARSIVWTFGVGALAALSGLMLGWVGFLLAPAAWLLQLVRLAGRHGVARGVHLLTGKFAEAWGIGKFALADLRGTRAGAIFYK